LKGLFFIYFLILRLVSFAGFCCWKWH